MTVNQIKCGKSDEKYVQIIIIGRYIILDIDII